MNSTSASFLPSPPSSPLSARLMELAQYMSAPLVGRLTDEQRSLCLAIARRLVMAVAHRIDPTIDANLLWSDWLERGLPHHEELVLACFARAEEHRWRRASEYSERLHSLAPLASQDEPELPIPWSLPHDDLRRAYADLLLADRRRFDAYGYPAMAIADVGEDVYRHLLNEVARWRLSQVSRDRHSAAGLGDAVRDAWQQRSRDQSIDEAAAILCRVLREADLLPAQIAAAAIRQDWLCFIGLTAAAQKRKFADMALFWITSSDVDRSHCLAQLSVGGEVADTLAASLAALPARVSAAGSVL